PPERGPRGGCEMLPIRIGLASQSSAVDLAQLVRVANALNVQITRDFAPIWEANASVAAIEYADSIDPGFWPIYICDELPPDMGGFHQTEHNQPYALVEAG